MLSKLDGGLVFEKQDPLFCIAARQVSRVLRLLSCNDKYLQLSAVRFLRSCVGIKDEFYNRCHTLETPRGKQCQHEIVNQRHPGVDAIPGDFPLSIFIARKK